MKLLIRNLLVIAILQFLSVNTLKAQWSTDLMFGGSLYTGNVSKTDIRSAGNTSWKDSIYEFAAFYKAEYGKADTVETNREFSGGISFDYMPESKISPFIVFEALNSIHQGYELRASAILGYKYTIIKKPKAMYSISAALMYDREKFTPDDEGKTKDDMNLMRLSIRPKFNQKFGDNIELKHVTYFKYTIFSSPEDTITYKNHENDWNIISTTTLSNKLTKKLSIDISYEFTYNGKPPKADIENTDQVIVVSLALKL